MLSNTEIKNLGSLRQRKYRRKEKKFLVEGFHLVEECLGSDYNLQTVIIRDRKLLNKYKSGLLAEQIKNRNIRLETISEKLFNKLSETKTSPGIIGVASFPKLRLPKQIDGGKIIIALDGINDPGNLGTILRTAYWFDVKTILLGKDSADPFNSKVLRSSQGGLFRINITDAYLNSELRRLHSSGYQILLLDARADSVIGDLDSGGKFVLVFGNEAGGISKSLVRPEYKKVRIAGFSPCESLNVAVACGIALHEIKRKIAS